MIPIPVRSLRTSTVRTAGFPTLLLTLGGILIAVQSAFAVTAPALLLPGLLIGVAIVAIGFGSVPRPSWARPLGATGLVLGIASLFVVSGFLVGALLSIAGGAVMAIFAQRAWTTMRPSGSAIRPEDLGPPCKKCGHRIPPWTTNCPYCASSGSAP